MKLISCLCALAFGLSLLPASASPRAPFGPPACERIPTDVIEDVFGGVCPAPTSGRPDAAK